jgi:hypothetical protein
MKLEEEKKEEEEEEEEECFVKLTIMIIPTALVR